MKNYPTRILETMTLIWFSLLFVFGVFAYFLFAVDDFLTVPAITWGVSCFCIFILLIDILGLTYHISKILKVFVFVKNLDQAFNYKSFLFLIWIPIASFVIIFVFYRKTVRVLNDNDLEKFDYDWNSIQKG